MISNDQFTGLISTIGGALVWSNVYRVWIDKQVKGANLIPALWFTLGASWQVYFLFSLHQTFASVGAFTIASGNCLWFLLATYYRFTTKPAK